MSVAGAAADRDPLAAAVAVVAAVAAANFEVEVRETGVVRAVASNFARKVA